MWRPVLVMLVVLARHPMASADDNLEAASALLRAAPVILTDGKGHYLAMTMPTVASSPSPLFYGTRTTLYYMGDHMQRLGSGDTKAHASGGRRGSSWNVEYSSTTSSATLRCRDREQVLQRVTGEPARSYLAAVKLEEAPAWKRIAARLARDDEGTYYFVDAYDAPERPADHRLFIGKRGAMAQVRLKDVVVDSSGELYISDRGTLKVIDYRDELAADQRKRGEVRRAESTWLARGKPTSLVTVSTQASSQLIVDELGAYVNQRFGNPCDVF